MYKAILSGYKPHPITHEAVTQDEIREHFEWIVGFLVELPPPRPCEFTVVDPDGLVLALWAYDGLGQHRAEFADDWPPPNYQPLPIHLPHTKGYFL